METTATGTNTAAAAPAEETGTTSTTGGIDLQAAKAFSDAINREQLEINQTFQVVKKDGYLSKQNNQ